MIFTSSHPRANTPSFGVVWTYSISFPPFLYPKQMYLASFIPTTHSTLSVLLTKPLLNKKVHTLISKLFVAFAGWFGVSGGTIVTTNTLDPTLKLGRYYYQLKPVSKFLAFPALYIWMPHSGKLSEEITRRKLFMIFRSCFSRSNWWLSGGLRFLNAYYHCRGSHILPGATRRRWILYGMSYVH